MKMKKNPVLSSPNTLEELLVCSDDLEKQNPLRSIYSQAKGARERSFVFIAHRDFVYILRYGYTHIGLPSEYLRYVAKTRYL